MILGGLVESGTHTGNLKRVAHYPASIGQHENRQAIADRMGGLWRLSLRSISDEEIANSFPQSRRYFALAGKIYSARRRVDAIFGMPGFCVSPAWDIMLDLYKARGSGRRISVTSASIGAALSGGTTALRWLQALENMGLNRAQGKTRMTGGESKSF